MLARGRATRRPLAAAFLLILATATALGPVGHAVAVAPGQIDHAELSTSSRFQGLGGPVVVTARVYFASDPHGTLVVNSLQVALNHGERFTLTSGENPVTVASLSVPATVNLYVASFTWTLAAAGVGDFSLTVNVTSAASGAAAASANVTVREGVVLGRPNLSPAAPTVTDALLITVAASSGFDEPNITMNVTLYVFERAGAAKPLSATGSRLRLSDGRTVLGTPLRMEGDNGTYSYVVPPRPRGPFVYWVFAETVYSNVTGAPSRVLVHDPGTTQAVYWGALGTTAAAVAAGLYLLLYDPLGRRPAAGSVHNSPDRIRVGVVMLALGVLLVGVAAWSGAPTGLWRWFGYL